MIPILPSLVTGLALLFYVATIFFVGQARGRYKIKAPATVGHPAFERAYRVQQNTVEQLVIFLPALWLFSFFVSPLWGAVIGVVWILGRILYALTYLRDAEKRGPGAMITMISGLLLLVGGLIGIVLRLASP
jgi:glutathione S-transferase